MEFNSLDAQREACEAYVASQRTEGWLLVPDRYTMAASPVAPWSGQRSSGCGPTIEAGKIDVVVVYRSTGCPLADGFLSAGRGV